MTNQKKQAVRRVKIILKLLRIASEGHLHWCWANWTLGWTRFGYEVVRPRQMGYDTDRVLYLMRIGRLRLWITMYW